MMDVAHGTHARIVKKRGMRKGYMLKVCTIYSKNPTLLLRKVRIRRSEGRASGNSGGAHAGMLMSRLSRSAQCNPRFVCAILGLPREARIRALRSAIRGWSDSGVCA